MNRIDKFLSKLSVRERVIVKKCLDSIRSGDFVNLNFKKLKGFDNLYRVRKGKIRVLFTKDKQKVDVINIEHRNEKTYKL